jgi:hypothetical protein
MDKGLILSSELAEQFFQKRFKIFCPRFPGLGLSRGVVFSRFSVGTNRGPRVFNLDVHTSIVSEPRKGAETFDLSITTWSISGGNRVSRKLFWVLDPVQSQSIICNCVFSIIRMLLHT